MKSLIDLFNPQKQTNIQKSGLFITLVIALVILGLHNPIDGYETRVWIAPLWDDCATSFRLQFPSLCEGSFQELDFLSWQSRGASLEVFKTIGSVLLWLSLLFVALSSFLLIFCGRNDIDSSSLHSIFRLFA